MSRHSHRREVVFVLGTGRSGTATLAGVLRELGLQVPGRVAGPGAAGPPGSDVLPWLADLHDGVLRRAGVSVADARPSAAVDVEHAAANAGTAATAAVRLDEHFRGADALMLQDPRLTWFLTPWRRAASTAGARASFATMLRPPPDLVGHGPGAAGPRSAADAVARWVNGMLHTELATRGAPRAFVRYEDLRTHWRGAVDGLTGTLGIRRMLRDDAEAASRVDALVEPDLRRVPIDWDELSLPPYLRDVAERTWAHLAALTTPDTDTAAGYPAADALRADYARAHERLDSASAYRRVRRILPRRVLSTLSPRLRGRLGRAARQVIADRV